MRNQQIAIHGPDQCRRSPKGDRELRDGHSWTPAEVHISCIRYVSEAMVQSQLHFDEDDQINFSSCIITSFFTFTPALDLFFEFALHLLPLFPHAPLLSLDLVRLLPDCLV